jgi:hypothetical protein
VQSTSSAAAAKDGLLVAERRQRRRDRRFLIAYVIWLMVTISYFSAGDLSEAATWISVLAVVVLGLPWLGFLIWAIVVALGRWRRGAVHGAVIAGLAPVVAIVAAEYGRYPAIWLRFELERARYVALIQAGRVRSRRRTGCCCAMT